MAKSIHLRKELRAILNQSKYFTFDQYGACFTGRRYESLCEVIKLEDVLQERIQDKLGPWFKGPGFLYVFKSYRHALRFVELNLSKYEDNIYSPDSKDIAYTLLMATATADLILQVDYQFIRTYLYHRDKGAIPEFKNFRSIKACLDQMNLVINQFKNK